MASRSKSSSTPIGQLRKRRRKMIVAASSHSSSIKGSNNKGIGMKKRTTASISPLIRNKGKRRRIILSSSSPLRRFPSHIVDRVQERNRGRKMKGAGGRRHVSRAPDYQPIDFGKMVGSKGFHFLSPNKPPPRKSTPEHQKIRPIPAEPKQYAWLYNVKQDYFDGCNKANNNDAPGGGEKPSTTITLKPYQSFVGKYLTPRNPLKGVLLYYSIGSGKLCTGINCAYQFQKKGWNVLWVTRTTLKADVDKNLFERTCHEGIIEAIQNGEIRRDTIEERKQYFRKHFRWIDTISFKAFSNLCGGRRTKLADDMDKLNGKKDPFRRTLIVIDEAHKFLEPEQFSVQERPEWKYVKKAIQHSYTASGDDSCKLLLMTGTAVGSRPEDTLLELMNLLIPHDKIVPADFNAPKVLVQKLKGLVLKLDISKDPSLFAQPRYSDVTIPMPGMGKERGSAKKSSSSSSRALTSKDKKMMEECLPLTSLAKAKAKFPNMTAAEFRSYKERCKDLKDRFGIDPNSQFGVIQSCLTHGGASGAAGRGKGEGKQQMVRGQPIPDDVDEE